MCIKVKKVLIRLIISVYNVWLMSDSDVWLHVCQQRSLFLPTQITELQTPESNTGSSFFHTESDWLISSRINQTLSPLCAVACIKVQHRKCGVVVLWLCSCDPTTSVSSLFVVTLPAVRTGRTCSWFTREPTVETGHVYFRNTAWICLKRVWLCVLVVLFIPGSEVWSK